MVVPIAYALSLAVMLLARDLFFVLPGSGNAEAGAAGCALCAHPPIVDSNIVDIIDVDVVVLVLVLVLVVE